MKMKEKIENYVSQRGCSIVIEHPLSWNESGQKYKLWHPTGRPTGRVYSYALSVPAVYQGAWLEPNNFYYSLAELFESVKEDLRNE